MTIPREAVEAVADIGATLAGLPPGVAAKVAGALADIGNSIASSPDPKKAAERAVVAVQAKLAYRAGGAALAKAKSRL